MEQGWSHGCAVLGQMKCFQLRNLGLAKTEYHEGIFAEEKAAMGWLLW